MLVPNVAPSRNLSYDIREVVAIHYHNSPSLLFHRYRPSILYAQNFRRAILSRDTAPTTKGLAGSFPQTTTLGPSLLSPILPGLGLRGEGKTQGEHTAMHQASRATLGLLEIMCNGFRNLKKDLDTGLASRNEWQYQTEMRREC